MRRVAVSVYAIAAAIIVVIALAGYTYASNLGHERDLRALNVQRQREINVFLREQVCARIELRDEINIAILDDARRRAAEAGLSELALNYEEFIAAIQNAQGECIEEIPGVHQR